MLISIVITWGDEPRGQEKCHLLEKISFLAGLTELLLDVLTRPTYFFLPIGRVDL